MARISFSSVGNTPFEQLLGHNPEILTRWTDLENSFFTSARLSAELREEVRRTLAYSNGCQYCMAKGKPAEKHSDPQIFKAAEFAKMIAIDHRKITDSDITALADEFSQDEISELCAFICFIIACQKFGAILDLKPTCSI